MSNTFKLPEIILNNLKNESNTDENIFCVYNYVQAEKEKEYPMMQRDWGIAESIAVLMRHSSFLSK